MDKIGFEARVRTLWPGMVRLARCVTHSHADAEDAAAQAVLNCYRRLASLRREDAFDAWLMRACLNEARNILRRRGRVELRGDWPDTPAGTDGGPELTPLLMRLDEKERVPLELMYFENYPLEEIAAVLGVPLGNAAAAETATLASSVGTSVGAGLGAFIAVVLFATVRQRIDERLVPPALRGLPISLVTASLMCMAFTCVAGIAGGLFA